MMSARLLMLAAALVLLSAGCHQKMGSDPAAEEACLEEGYDPGTTEYANCLEELSGAD